MAISSVTSSALALSLLYALTLCLLSRVDISAPTLSDQITQKPHAMASWSLVAANTKPTSSTEVNALLAFRSSIQTDPTGALGNWTLENNSSHCSTWKGVKCGAGGEVISIVLPGLGLHGSITGMIGDLFHLTVLNLTGSSLRGPIPWELGKCQNLSFLDLSSNKLTGSIPSSLVEMSKFEDFICC